MQRPWINDCSRECSAGKWYEELSCSSEVRDTEAGSHVRTGAFDSTVGDRLTKAAPRPDFDRRSGPKKPVDASLPLRGRKPSKGRLAVCCCSFRSCFGVGWQHREKRELENIHRFARLKPTKSNCRGHFQRVCAVRCRRCLPNVAPCSVLIWGLVKVVGGPENHS